MIFPLAENLPHLSFRHNHLLLDLQICMPFLMFEHSLPLCLANWQYPKLQLKPQMSLPLFTSLLVKVLPQRVTIVLHLLLYPGLVSSSIYAHLVPCSPGKVGPPPHSPAGLVMSITSKGHRSPTQKGPVLVKTDLRIQTSSSTHSFTKYRGQFPQCSALVGLQYTTYTTPGYSSKRGDGCEAGG